MGTSPAYMVRSSPVARPITRRLWTYGLGRVRSNPGYDHVGQSFVGRGIALRATRRRRFVDGDRIYRPRFANVDSYRR